MIHTFRSDIYPLNLYVLTNNPNDLNKSFLDKDKKPIHSVSEDGSIKAWVYNEVVRNKGCYGIAVVVPDKIGIGQIAHEATHVARLWWDWLTEDLTGREADAYLVQWIVEKLDTVNTLTYGRPI